MKVFISSVIGGFEQYRDAASRAARTLRHEVRGSEDFGASPASPRQTCLAGVRWADVVVLLVGARYGERQSSGISATHEEYREARGTRDVLAFVQQGTQREPAQEQFVKEVRDWSAGTYTNDFRTPEELADGVVRALHELELSRVGGPADEKEILGRAESVVPRERGGEETLTVVVAAGPPQAVLRPAELEDDTFHRALMQEALFGPATILDRAEGTRARLHGDSLLIEQDSRSILLDALGTVRIVQPARRRRRSRGSVDLPALIEEDVQELIQGALRFSGWILDRIDPVMRLADVVPVAVISGALSWRTRAEHEASPNSMGMRMGSESVKVCLSPPRRHRAALTQDVSKMAEDLTVLLRRRLRA